MLPPPAGSTQARQAPRGPIGRDVTSDTLPTQQCVHGERMDLHEIGSDAT
jgi:hypothetical protein